MTEAAGHPSFGDLVADAVTARESQLVLGLDPDPARLWPQAAEPADGTGSRAGPGERAARAIATHCALVLAASAEHCVAVKLQVACFERLGAPGWQALADVTDRAREHGLLVIADAKRGDIDVTASAYAQAFFGVTETPYGSVKGLGVDALTANPLLGSDSLAPLVAGARASGAGLFVLVRTSNPGATDVQDVELSGGGTLSGRLAELVTRLGADGVGRSGLSDVGAVVGATVPDRIASLRELMPATIFLLPGVGPQGGSVKGLGPAFAIGRAGGLVPVSRAIVEASDRLGGEPAAAARKAAAGLRELIWGVVA